MQEPAIAGIWMTVEYEYEYALRHDWLILAITSEPAAAVPIDT